MATRQWFVDLVVKWFKELLSALLFFCTLTAWGIYEAYDVNQGANRVPIERQFAPDSTWSLLNKFNITCAVGRRYSEEDFLGFALFAETGYWRFEVQARFDAFRQIKNSLVSIQFTFDDESFSVWHQGVMIDDVLVIQVDSQETISELLDAVESHDEMIIEARDVLEDSRVIRKSISLLGAKVEMAKAREMCRIQMGSNERQQRLETSSSEQ